MRNFAKHYGRKMAFLLILLFGVGKTVNYIDWHPQVKQNFWTYVGNALAPLMIIAILGTIFWFAWKAQPVVGAVLLLVYGLGLGMFLKGNNDFSLMPLAMLVVLVVLIFLAYGTLADYLFPEKVTTWWHDRQERKAADEEETVVQPVVSTLLPVPTVRPVPASQQA